MRHIIIDYARERRAQKRGGQWNRVALQDADSSSSIADVDILELDEALLRLNALHMRQAQIVELRFFAGLTSHDIAGLLGISEETVKRDWRMARAWLMSELGPGGNG
jgi:RNA polymerase sigma factor (TIGR02999 family)